MARTIERSSVDLEGPDLSKPPLKANIFRAAAAANCTLQPMFPYVGPGDIAPCSAMMRGRPGASFGHFFHENTNDEIVLVFGSNLGMLPTGTLANLGRKHGVNSFLKEPENPEALLVNTVTQRQSDEGEQDEALRFRCEECRTELLRFEFNGTTAEDQDGLIGMFTTIWGSATAVEKLNIDSRLLCGECGHKNSPFPIGEWGWANWVTRRRTAIDARRALDEAICEAGLVGTTT